MAMVIISAVMCMSFLIMSNILTGSNPKLNYLAYAETQSLLRKIRTTGVIEEGSWEIHGIHMELNLLEYLDYKNLYILEIKAFDKKGKLIILKRELIVHNN